MNVMLHINGEKLTLESVSRKTHEISFKLAGKTYVFRSQRLTDGTWLLEQETAPGVWQRMSGASWQGGRNFRRVQLDGLEAKVSEPSANVGQSSVEGALSPIAPMPGVVRQVLVKQGERVAQGQPLVVMEAMKLQMTLSAGGPGKVAAVLVEAGEMVSEGAELVRLTPLSEKAA